METTVLELLAGAQADQDAGRVDTVFQLGDRVLLRTKELLDAANIGKLRQRWDGPFTVLACPSPNARTLALPRLTRCSPTVTSMIASNPSLSVPGAAGPGARRRLRIVGRARGGGAA